MSVESVMPSNYLILCCSLLLLFSIFSSITVFSNESALQIRWPKYWSLSFNISSSNEHPGLISFRMNWLDLLAVQGIRKSLLKHHSSNLLVNISQGRFPLFFRATFIVRVTWDVYIMKESVESKLKILERVMTRAWREGGGIQLLALEGSVCISS